MMRRPLDRRTGILCISSLRAGDRSLLYVGSVLILGIFVNFMLILGTNRLTGFPPGIKRSFAAASIGGFYAALSSCASLYHMGYFPWRMVFVVVTSLVAFGWRLNDIRRGAVYVLLSLALGGIASGIDAEGFGGLCLCSILIWLLCRIGFRHGIGGREYLPAELSWNGKSVRLTAMRDTGNTLRDPMTGEQVLVCGSDVGETLLGIPGWKFSDPVGTLLEAPIPGLRLLPFRTVGQAEGFMLALRLRNVKIGDRISSPMVAFSPCAIGNGEGYQMLTGGF